MKKVKLIFANKETELSSDHSMIGIGFRLYFDSEENLGIQPLAGNMKITRADKTIEEIEKDKTVKLNPGDNWEQDRTFGHLKYEIISIE